jgi:hypothetical protein
MYSLEDQALLEGEGRGDGVYTYENATGVLQTVGTVLLVSSSNTAFTD